MEADGLFVYGPLRQGGRSRAWLDRTHPQGSCTAWVAGRLFHLPREGVPAMIATPEPGSPPPSSGWITGEFIGYDDAQELDAALADLDQLEDVEGGRCLRQVLPVVLESGHRYGAWVYLFPPERLPRLEREAVELADGDWAPYLEGDLP